METNSQKKIILRQGKLMVRAAVEKSATVAAGSSVPEGTPDGYQTPGVERVAGRNVREQRIDRSDMQVNTARLAGIGVLTDAKAACCAMPGSALMPERR